MSVHRIIEPFTWNGYAKNLKKKILAPRSVGVIQKEDVPGETMRLITGKEGSVQDGNCLVFYLIVDEEDGVIADVKFQCYGQTALIGAAELIAEMALRKSHMQARRITADLIDREARDKRTVPAFPKETAGHLNLALAALDDALAQCEDIPVSEEYDATPIHSFGDDEVREYPNWDVLGKDEKIAAIREVISKEVSPYVELDAGGVDVVDFKGNKEVIIAYQGACTSCHAATGSTLSAIEHILKSRVHPSLTVTPDLSFLQ